MKKDTSNIIDLDSLFENNKQHMQTVNEGVEVTSEVGSVDFDEVLSEWSYRCPKGYPTVVDGVFTERAEVEILNQLLEERGLQTLPLPIQEAGKTKTIKVVPKFVSWYKTVDKSTITPFLETAPIVESLIKGKVTIQNMISTIKDNPSMDWNPGVLAVVDSMKKAGVLADKSSIEYLNNEYLMGKEPSSPINQQSGNNLKSLNNNKPISSFIHGRVREFYSLVDSNAKGEENKVFTADVIVFWNVADPFAADIQQAISKSLSNPVIKEKSLVDLGKNRYMACVSLKANEGRLGKLTAWARKYSISEGFLGDLVSTIKQSSIGKTLYAGYEKTKQFFTKLGNTINSIFTRDNPDVISYEEASNALMELNNLIESEVALAEDSDDKILCTTCHREQIYKIQKFVEKALAGTALDDFRKSMKKYEDGSLIRTRYINVNLDKLESNSGRNALQKTMTRIIKAKTITKEGASKCTLLYEGSKPLTFSRSEFKNIIFNNGNAMSLDLIQRMMQDTFKAINIDDIKKKRDALITLTTTLSAEAVFGKSVGLPLVKYTGSHMYQLGTKQDYIKDKKKQLASVFNAKDVSSTYPVLGIRVEPSKGKSGEAPYYFNITMYSLDNVEIKGKKSLDPKDITYAQIGFKCNSGSKFAFVIEGDNIVSGESLLKAFAK